MPKFNMYQSLHTTVIGPEGKPVELQIRTWDMHRRAEYGVAAHWKYKEETVFGRAKDAKDDSQDMAWLRQLVDWQRETDDPAEFLESLRFDLAAAEVYVFTPRGEVDRAAAGRDAGGLRLRHPHRGRAPHASAPGSTAAWSRWSRPWTTATRWRSSPPRRPTPGRAGTGSSSCKSAAGPEQDPALVLQGAPGSGDRGGQGRRSPRRMRKQGLPLQRIAAGDAC